MKARLPVVLSLTALVVAVAGITPLGEAARERLVPLARFARNADKVDGIHAARTPRPGRLLALGRNAKFPGSALPAGPAGLTALEIASAATAQDSSTPKTATVNCPAGKRVVGGGARVTGAGATEVAVSEAFPNSPTQWVTLAREVNPTGSSWTLAAYAFCAAGS